VNVGVCAAAVTAMRMRANRTRTSKYAEPH
jgi:hypothetical protein